MQLQSSRPTAARRRCWRRTGTLRRVTDPSAGAGIQLGGLSSYPTHTTVDRFEVQLSNLTALEAYEVIVSSDSAARLGIGGCGCGSASQTQTVTGGGSGSDIHRVCLCGRRRHGDGRGTPGRVQHGRGHSQPAPHGGADPGVRARGSGAARAPARVGTPGLVLSISFPTKTTSSIKVTWDEPSDGGRALTGFGLLWWTGNDEPAYSTALVKGAAAREHTYTGLQADTTCEFPHPCLQRPRQLRLVDRPAQGGDHPAGAAGHGHGGARGAPQQAARGEH